MDDLGIFIEKASKQGKEYIENLDFEIPIRIQNILKDKYFKSEKDFYEYLENIIFYHTSFYLFPNNLCSFYPRLLQHKASKNLTCYLSGAPIKIGEEYCCYRPLLENLET